MLSTSTSLHFSTKPSPLLSRFDSMIGVAKPANTATSCMSKFFDQSTLQIGE